MNKQTTTQPRVLRRLLIFTLVALLAVAAVAYADNNSYTNNANLQLTTAQQTAEKVELSTKEIAQRNLPSIVSISTEAVTTLDYGSSPFGYYFGYGYGGRSAPREYRSVGAGSGIILSEDGYILTNSHVVEGATSVQVSLNDDTTYDAVLVGSDAVNDIAVLKVNATGLTPAVFGDSDELQIAETAMVIGNPLGEVNGSVSVGVISALPRTITIDNQDMTLLQTDAAINPGNSGGALINSFGEVIGIVTAKTSAVQVEGIGYAIPINEVKDRIEELVNTPVEDLPAEIASQDDTKLLGISVNDVTPELAQQYNMPQGVYVVEVQAGSAAEKAGIKQGDIIIRLAGEDATTHAKLETAKEKVSAGVETDITIIRSGEEMNLKITLGKAPSA